jgi:hypothetical protein
MLLDLYILTIATRHEGRKERVQPLERLPLRLFQASLRRRGKKLKVLTYRPRYIEPAIVPEFGGETSSAIEAKGPTPTQRIEERAAMPKTDKIEELRIEGTKTLEVLSPSAGVEVSKTQKGLVATPKRKRMASVLDVLETIKASSLLGTCSQML